MTSPFVNYINLFIAISIIRSKILEVWPRGITLGASKTYSPILPFRAYPRQVDHSGHASRARAVFTQPSRYPAPVRIQ